MSYRMARTFSRIAKLGEKAVATPIAPKTATSCSNAPAGPTPDPKALLVELNVRVAAYNADKPEADQITPFEEVGEAWPPAAARHY